MNDVDEQIKGTLVISMDSDGDFGFRNLESIKNNGWVIWPDDDSYSYTFRLENFVGNRYELASKVNAIFAEISTHRIYIMRDICEVFEKIEDNCKSDDMQPNLYLDYGNQTYEADFNFGAASHLNAYKKLLESKEEDIIQHEQYLKKLKEEAEMIKAEIAKMEAKEELS